MNVHQVATPELSAEDAKSYVFFFREGSGFLAYIGLYFLHSDRRLYYRHSANPFAENEMSSVEDEARSFAEDMGAMLDEIDMAKMSVEEKNRWIDEQDIFSVKKKKGEDQADAQAATAAAGVQNTQQEQAFAAQPMSSAGPVPVDEVAGVRHAPDVPQAPTVQSSPAVQSATVVQPAPIAQPEPIPRPEPPSVPEIPSAQLQIQAGTASTEVTPVPPVPTPQPHLQASPAPRPQTKKESAVFIEVVQSGAPAVTPESSQQPAPLQRADDVLEEAVRARVVKAPKAKLKKDMQTVTGVVSRDKEALARLLASF